MEVPLYSFSFGVILGVWAIISISVAFKAYYANFSLKSDGNLGFNFWLKCPMDYSGEYFHVRREARMQLADNIKNIKDKKLKSWIICPINSGTHTKVTGGDFWERTGPCKAHRSSRFCSHYVRWDTKQLTFTFKALAHQTPQHFSTMIAESGGSVGMNEESMRPDLEVFKGGRSCRNSTLPKKLSEYTDLHTSMSGNRWVSREAFLETSCGKTS